MNWIAVGRALEVEVSLSAKAEAACPRACVTWVADHLSSQNQNEFPTMERKCEKLEGCKEAGARDAPRERRMYIFQSNMGE
jgi:hypothetical protein